MNEFEKYLENNGYKDARLYRNESNHWLKDVSFNKCNLEIWIAVLSDKKYRVEISLLETYYAKFVVELSAFSKKTFTDKLNKKINELKAIAINDINNTKFKDNE